MNRNFFLPKISEREAAGKLMRIPGMVEAEAMKPIHSVGVLRLEAKGLRTGLLDMVELRIAKNPIMQSVKNALFATFFVCKFICASCFILAFFFSRTHSVVFYPFSPICFCIFLVIVLICSSYKVHHKRKLPSQQLQNHLLH